MAFGLDPEHPLHAAYAALATATEAIARASSDLASAAADQFSGDRLHAGLTESSHEELLALRRAIAKLELHFADLTYRYTKAANIDPSQYFDDEPFQTIREECRMTFFAVHNAYVIGEMRAHLPLATAALQEGRIGQSHLGYIANLATNLFNNPTTSRTDLFDEATLVEAASKLNVVQFRRVCEDIRHQADHARFVADEQSDAFERVLEMKNHEGGYLELRGCFDPEAGCLIRSVIEPLAKRDGSDDTRSVAQRNADALVEACQHVLDSGSLPQSGGVRPHLYVTCTLETLRDIAGAPAADLQGTAMVSGTKVERLSCDATIMRVLVDSAGMPIDVGRAQRVVPPATRRALIARDRGCVWRGCTRTAGWTQAHHLHHWALGGRTDVGDMVLLCHRHHWMVHEGGYRLVRTAEGGVVVVAPGPGWWQHSGRDPTTLAA